MRPSRARRGIPQHDSRNISSTNIAIATATATAAVGSGERGEKEGVCVGSLKGRGEGSGGKDRRYGEGEVGGTITTSSRCHAPYVCMCERERISHAHIMNMQ